MKKLTILIVVFLVNLNAVKAQWVQKASHTGGPRGLCASFSINNNIYVFGGSTTTSNVYNELWEYNTLANTWTQKANFPGGSRVASTAFAIGTKGYVGMGSNFFTYYDDFWEYDPATDTWLQKANYPGGTRQSATGLAIGNKGYVCGGLIYTGSNIIVYNDFWEYDPSNDSWTVKTSMPGPARSDVAACAIGNIGYMGLGTDKVSTSFTDFYSYDPSTDSWTTLNSPSGSSTGASAMFIIGTDCYLVGGHDWSNNSTSNTTQRYITATDTWTNAPTFPGGSVYYHVAASVNGKGYAGTGGNASLVPKSDWWMFTPPAPLNATSIAKKSEDKKTIHVYPNPFKDQITVSFLNTESKGYYALAVKDVLGREIFYTAINYNTASEYSVQLPPDLSTGIYSYFLRDAKGTNIVSGKIVKE